MSTVDPTLARKLRQAKRPSGLRVAVLLLVLFAGGFGLGLGWGSFSLFDGSADPPLWMIPGVVGGLLLTILGFIGWLGVVVRRADVGLDYGGAALLIGGGAGLLVAAAPAGFPLLAVIIAATLLLVGVVLGVLGAAAAASRRRQTARDEETMRTGTLTTATVSDQGYTGFHTSPRVLAAVTFTFTDLHGTQRWVQRPVFIEQSDPVVTGETTRLWYDAQNPGDQRRIVVEAAHARRHRR